MSLFCGRLSICLSVSCWKPCCAARPYRCCTKLLTPGAPFRHPEVPQPRLFPIPRGLWPLTESCSARLYVRFSRYTAHRGLDTWSWSWSRYCHSLLASPAASSLSAASPRTPRIQHAKGPVVYTPCRDRRLIGCRARALPAWPPKPLQDIPGAATHRGSTATARSLGPYPPIIHPRHLDLV